ncbi:unnamed protein product [Pylaiella littoralis]
MPHLLLHGPPGSGKTSAVQAIAGNFMAEQDCLQWLKLTASDVRGVDTMRNQIQSFTKCFVCYRFNSSKTGCSR